MPTIQYRNKVGERVPGVTTVIGQNCGWSKKGLMYWAWDCGVKGLDYRKVSDFAASAGTIAHEMIEFDLKGKKFDGSKYLPELVQKAETSYLNFLEWKDNMKFEIVEIEPHLVSEQFQYGLTPDVIPRVKNRLCIFDWKTGNDIYPDTLCQLEAYRRGWDEVHPDTPIEGGYHLIRLSKEEAAFVHYYWQELPGAWEAYLDLLDLHNRVKVLKKLI